MTTRKQNTRKKNGAMRIIKQYANRMTMWFKHLPQLQIVYGRRRTRAPARGDIGVSVDGSANRSILVAARQIVFQAPMVAIPIVVLAALGAVIAGLAVISAANVVTPEERIFPKDSLPYGLDIVILPFESASPGDTSCTRLANELADEIANTITHALEFQESGEEINSSIQVWGPRNLRPEDVTGPASSEAKAAKLGDDGADIALFGAIECGAAGLTVTPRFFIAPSLFKDAPEFYGTYELGSFSSPISQPGDNQAVSEIKREIADRATLMAILSEGFGYYARDSYKDYLTAVDVFTQITALPAQPNKDILAIAHVFIGNAYLKASDGDCGAVLNADQLQAAEQHYNQALEYQPELALAYLGLADVMKLRIIYLASNDPAAVKDYLARQEQLYTQALSYATQPSFANIEWKVNYEVAVGRIQAKLTEHDNSSPNQAGKNDPLLFEANAMALQLVDLCQAGMLAGSAPQPSIVFAYRVLGDIATSQGRSADALAYYGQAAQAATSNRQKTALALNMANTMNDLGDFCGAARQYQIAANTTICSADRLEYATYARDFQMQCEMSSTGRMEAPQPTP